MSYKYNLRNQYRILVIIITVILIGISVYANHYIQSHNNHDLLKSNNRVKMSSSINLLHQHIDDTKNTLNLFLLSPSVHLRQQFFKELEATNKTIIRISSNTWISENSLDNELADFNLQLVNLSNAANTIMNLRRENNQIFPALGIAEQRMMQSQLNFIEEINLAIQDIKSTAPFNLLIYDDFVELRDKWRRLTLAFRLYLIQQMAALNKDKTATIVQNIDLYGDDIISSFDTKFRDYSSNKNLSLQLSFGIEEMRSSADTWISNYEKIRIIHAKGEWRKDVTIILNTINPIYEEISYNLIQFKLALNLSSVLELKKRQKDTELISQYFWIVFIVFICILAFIYIIIDRQLLKPISNLSNSIEKYANVDLSKSDINSNSQEISSFLAIFDEMQKQVKSREEKLEYLALHDNLTNLPNRSLLFDRINVAINNYQRNKKSLAIFMLDLNKFKEVNDNLGHKIGDSVLVKISTRLKSILRKTDTVARIGGDEFSILMLNTSPQAITDLANKINASLTQTLYIENHEINIGTSIRIAIFPKHGFNYDMLLYKADLAMYYSKKHKTNFTIYSDSITNLNSESA